MRSSLGRPETFSSSAAGKNLTPMTPLTYACRQMGALGNKASCVNIHPLRPIVAHVSLLGAARSPDMLAAINRHLLAPHAPPLVPFEQPQGLPQPPQLAPGPSPPLLPSPLLTAPRLAPPAASPLPFLSPPGLPPPAPPPPGPDDPPYWTEPLPLTLPPGNAFSPELLEGARYGLPTPLPPQLEQGVLAYEGWSKATLQLDRVGPHIRPVQGVTFKGQQDCIRQYMGFLVHHFGVAPSALELSLYQDAAKFITFITFLKVSG